MVGTQEHGRYDRYSGGRELLKGGLLRLAIAGGGGLKRQRALWTKIGDKPPQRPFSHFGRNILERYLCLARAKIRLLPQARLPGKIDRDLAGNGGRIIGR